jgi:HEXXH motif-containing protein
MRKITLDRAGAAMLLFPGPDMSLAEGLFRKVHDNVMIRLVRAVREVLQCAPDIAVKARFGAAFDSLCSFSPQTQMRILSYPSLAFWTDVTEELLRREAHIRFPYMQFDLHLQELWRFAAAGALLDLREHYSCSLRSNGLGVISLPGTTTFLSGESLGAYEAVECVLHRGQFSSLKTCIGNKIIQPRVARLPVVLNGSTELNSIDENLRLPGRTTYAFEVLQPEHFPRWLSALEDAWDLLVNSCGPLAKELPLGVRSLVPVLDGGIDTHSSASFSEAPGLIALSWHPDPVILAEALVHEYHHQKLNSLQLIDPLILGPPEARFYSPWRPDPRPLNGILHGAYVFQAVLQWWETLCPGRVATLTAERITSRKYVICCQLLSALTTLRSSAKLTLLGKWLCEAMTQTVKQRAEHLGKQDIPDRAAIDRALEQHLYAWRQNNDHVWLLSHREDQSEDIIDEVKADFDLLVLLGFDARERNRSFSAALLESDALLECIARLTEHEKVLQLREALGPYSDFETTLRSIIRGHLAYSTSEYEDAIRYYAAAVAKVPTSAKLWQSFAFALRHTGRWQESSLILSNIGALIRKASSLAFNTHAEPAEIMAVVSSAIRDEGSCDNNEPA